MSEVPLHAPHAKRVHAWAPVRARRVGPFTGGKARFIEMTGTIGREIGRDLRALAARNHPEGRRSFSALPVTTFHPDRELSVADHTHRNRWAASSFVTKKRARRQCGRPRAWVCVKGEMARNHRFGPPAASSNSWQRVSYKIRVY